MDAPYRDGIDVPKHGRLGTFHLPNISDGADATLSERHLLNIAANLARCDIDAQTWRATYFITINLAERRSTALTDEIDFLRDAFRRVKSRHPFEIDAMVVLPDHLHLLMTLPPDDANFSMRIGAIKSTFSRKLPKTEHVRESRISNREARTWHLAAPFLGTFDSR
jgi:REP element-mobilizing transposase RayT